MEVAVDCRALFLLVMLGMVWGTSADAQIPGKKVVMVTPAPIGFAEEVEIQGSGGGCFMEHRDSIVIYESFPFNGVTNLLISGLRIISYTSSGTLMLSGPAYFAFDTKNKTTGIVKFDLTKFSNKDSDLSIPFSGYRKTDITKLNENAYLKHKVEFLLDVGIPGRSICRIPLAITYRDRVP